MHADHAVDDEFEAGEADALVRYAGKIEGTVGVAHVHGDLHRNGRHGIHFYGALVIFEHAVVHIPGIALGAGHRDRLALLDGSRGGAAADDRRYAELARDEGRMAGAPAAIGDDGRSALHHGFPVRVGHVGHEHVARPDSRHFLHVLDDARRSRADALADAAAGDQRLRAGFQGEAQYGAARAALYGFRARLQNVDLAGGAVLAPLDVHRRAVVFLDDQRL